MCSFLIPPFKKKYLVCEHPSIIITSICSCFHSCCKVLVLIQLEHKLGSISPQLEHKFGSQINYISLHLTYDRDIKMDKSWMQETNKFCEQYVQGVGIGIQRYIIQNHIWLLNVIWLVIPNCMVSLIKLTPGDWIDQPRSAICIIYCNGGVNTKVFNGFIFLGQNHGFIWSLVTLFYEWYVISLSITIEN